MADNKISEANSEEVVAEVSERSKCKASKVRPNNTILWEPHIIKVKTFGLKKKLKENRCFATISISIDPI